MSFLLYQTYLYGDRPVALFILLKFIYHIAPFNGISLTMRPLCLNGDYLLPNDIDRYFYVSAILI